MKTNSYKNWVASQPFKKKPNGLPYRNGSHEIQLGSLRENLLGSKSRVSTAKARIMVNKERCKAENALEDVNHEEKKAERKLEREYTPSNDGERQLKMYITGEASPSDKERRDMLDNIKLVANRAGVPMDGIKDKKSVCEALSYVSKPYLAEKEHNTLEKSGDLEDEILNTPENKLNWIDFDDSASLDIWNKLEDERRKKEWLALKPSLRYWTVKIEYKGKIITRHYEDNKLLNKFITRCGRTENIEIISVLRGEFLVRAVIPEFGIDYHQCWTTEKGVRKLATWKNYTEARSFVYARIVQKNCPDFEGSLANYQHTKKAVDDLCEAKGVRLEMSLCDVQCKERKVETKTLVFGIHRKLTEATRYAEYSKAQNKALLEKALVGDDASKFNEYILRNAEGCDDKNALNHYDLEKAIMNGAFDTEDLIASTFEHEDDTQHDNEVEDILENVSNMEYYSWESQKLQKQYGFKRSEVSEAAWSYIQLHKEYNRFDIVDECIDRDESDFELTYEIAESIWEGGRFSPEHANTLFGTFWNDEEGNKRRGKYLYRTLDKLIENDYFETCVQSAKDEYEDAQQKHFSIVCDKQSPLHIKKLWGKTKGEMDEAMIKLSITELLNSSHDEGSHKWNEVIRTAVYEKALMLEQYHGHKAVYG